MANKIHAYEQALAITKIAAANVSSLHKKTGQDVGEFMDAVYEAICKINSKANGES